MRYSRNWLIQKVQSVRCPLFFFQGNVFYRQILICPIGSVGSPYNSAFSQHMQINFFLVISTSLIEYTFKKPKFCSTVRFLRTPKTIRMYFSDSVNFIRRMRDQEKLSIFVRYRTLIIQFNFLRHFLIGELYKYLVGGVPLKRKLLIGVLTT